MQNPEGGEFRSQDNFTGPEPNRRADSRADVFARLEQAVGAIHDSNSFRRYLDMQARFHNYSFGNVALILSQRPDSTQVAGYNTWLKLHRYVRRGEHGIRIVVPMRRKRQQEDSDEASRVFFGSGTVFDVDQTEGEPLPELSVPVLEGEDGRELYSGLLGLATQEQLSISTGDASSLPEGAMGVYIRTRRAILIRPAAPLQMTKTLAHERGHHFSGIDASTEENETIAESVAYVVCAHFGLDTGARSFPYVAAWAREPALLKRVLSVVQRVSRKIIDGLEGRNDGDTDDIGDRSAGAGLALGPC